MNINNWVHSIPGGIHVIASIIGLATAGKKPTTGNMVSCAC